MSENNITTRVAVFWLLFALDIFFCPFTFKFFESCLLLFFFKFYFIFKLYKIVLVLPDIYLFLYFSFFFYLSPLKNLFLALLGLPCLVWAFSICGEWGLLFVVLRGLLIVVASLVEHRF